MKIGYKRTDINTGFAVTVITIKLDAGYAQKVVILGNMGESALVSHLKNMKYQQCHLCIKVLEKDFSSPGKVLEKSLNVILETCMNPVSRRLVDTSSRPPSVTSPPVSVTKHTEYGRPQVKRSKI